jgi:hypothetical protein
MPLGCDGGIRALPFGGTRSRSTARARERFMSQFGYGCAFGIEASVPRKGMLRFMNQTSNGNSFQSHPLTEGRIVPPDFARPLSMGGAPRARVPIGLTAVPALAPCQGESASTQRCPRQRIHMPFVQQGRCHPADGTRTGGVLERHAAHLLLNKALGSPPASAGGVSTGGTWR